MARTDPRLAIYSGDAIKPRENCAAPFRLLSVCGASLWRLASTRKAPISMRVAALRRPGPACRTPAQRRSRGLVLRRAADRLAAARSPAGEARGRGLARRRDPHRGRLLPGSRLQRPGRAPKRQVRPRDARAAPRPSPLSPSRGLVPRSRGGLNAVVAKVGRFRGGPARIRGSARLSGDTSAR